MSKNCCSFDGAMLSEAKPQVTTADATDSNCFVGEHVSGQERLDDSNSLRQLKQLGYSDMKSILELPQIIDYNTVLHTKVAETTCSRLEAIKIRHTSR